MDMFSMKPCYWQLGGWGFGYTFPDICVTVLFVSALL